MFGQWLNSWDLNVKVELPGSHGILYPWEPPLIGVPIEFLRYLDKMLFDLLSERAVLGRKVHGSQSRRSSGVSNRSEEVDFILPGGFILLD
jgi:hypothetical protein